MKYEPTREELGELGFSEAGEIQCGKVAVSYMWDGTFQLWESDFSSKEFTLEQPLNIESKSDLTTFLKIISQPK